ncbi:WXG100 family type VII secretion target [Streptacidiphilus neutrinimicus]|uniref:WXG100 family type VII secretion target n=1 Tax=Streptacidiphilus neutrinimicus TaxID=105420 RepID=UPI000694B80F|nr:hypothetical protein [Streptacidiphilus neutrinimicus]
MYVSSDFYIDPAAVMSLADEFQAAADALGGRAPAFASNVLEIGDAFGLLGECTGAAEQYQQLVNHTGHGLGELEQALAADAAGLVHTADQYILVDQHNSGLLGGN